MGWTGGAETLGGEVGVGEQQDGWLGGTAGQGLTHGPGCCQAEADSRANRPVQPAQSLPTRMVGKGSQGVAVSLATGQSQEVADQ